uniref:Uncharacterized protein n=1 Tax=Tanacetum cinerariifolium TaxID=118510 RepID=A0A6L2JLA6_TANCI|nr:hypothetical protein [Tanacetum cinerariifolium]
MPPSSTSSPPHPYHLLLVTSIYVATHPPHQHHHLYTITATRITTLSQPPPPPYCRHCTTTLKKGVWLGYDNQRLHQGVRLGLGLGLTAVGAFGLAGNNKGEECCVEVPDKQKQKMEDTMFELIKICQEKEFLCIHDDIDDLIESTLDSKLLLINLNSQRLAKKEQEVKNVVEHPAERGNHKPERLLSMRYEHLSITPETESDEVTESNAENLLPIPSKCEVTLEDKNECDLPISEKSPVCDNHSDTFSDSKINEDISVYDDDFENIEYVEASLSDPEIVSVEEEVDFEDISQIQDVVLREKLLSITRLISNIESLNDNSTPDCVLNSFESDNSLLDNFSPEFKTFCDHSEETRSGNTTHADYSLPEYDSFCFEIKPGQEKLINLMKNDIFDSLNDPLLEEVDLFLSNNSIPTGIENITDDPEGDIHFLEELLIDDSIISHESFDSNFEDNPSISRPPPKPPDAETDAGEEILVVMNDKDEFDNDDYSSFMFVIFAKEFSLLSAESEDTIFDPGLFPSERSYLVLDSCPVSKIFISFD